MSPSKAISDQQCIYVWCLLGLLVAISDTDIHADGGPSIPAAVSVSQDYTADLINNGIFDNGHFTFNASGWVLGSAWIHQGGSTGK